MAISSRRFISASLPIENMFNVSLVLMFAVSVNENLLLNEKAVEIWILIEK